MSDNTSHPQILADAKTGVVTIELETDYGLVSFSYSPTGIEAGIAALAADILKRAKEGRSQAHTVERLGVPPEVVTDAAALYEERANQIFPMDAIEQFSPSSESYSRGTVEQLSDNLVPGIILMLDHLAASALIVGGIDSDPGSEQTVKQAHQATIEMLQECLGKSIQQLSARSRPEASGTDSR